MKVGCILGNDSLSIRSKGGGRLLKSFGIVDLVVNLEDGCGSSILVDFMGFH